MALKMYTSEFIYGDESKTPHLGVIGYKFQRFDDPDNAIHVHEERHLVEWHGLRLPSTKFNAPPRKPRMLDRYDVRNLLDDERLFTMSKERKAQLAPPTAEELQEQKELDVERYRDLPIAKLVPAQPEKRPAAAADDSEAARKRQKTSGDGPSYKATGFSYGTSGPQTGKPDASPLSPRSPKADEKSDEWTPPFPCPKLMVKPPDDTQHQIVWRTAKFVAEQGSQAEFMLKVKHSDNPKFEFLLDHSALHPYYQFVKKRLKAILDWQELIEKENKLKEAQQPPPPPPPPALPTPAVAKPPLTEAARLAKQNKIVFKLSQSLSSSTDSAPASLDASSSASASASGSAPASAMSDVSRAALEAIQSKMVVPPDSIKQVIDKLSEYVSKHGAELEERIKEKEKNNPNFGFFAPGHPYHAYYLQRVHPSGAAAPPRELTEDEKRAEAQRIEALRLERERIENERRNAPKKFESDRERDERVKAETAKREADKKALRLLKVRKAKLLVTLLNDQD